ncbi:zwei Ig domain protein zig-8-like [Cherax quadricarinatus]|uniref:zwei Ig domain protein zig-8-like n=1 Tax=Cherax quadricarinatus TaxID=27406 RepID=UPI00387E7048
MTGDEGAVSFDSVKLESSSHLWSGYPHILTPSFQDTAHNITALVGDSAFLPCTVSHLGDRSVTWMRKRDLHILTAGIYTYSADERYQVLHPENSNDWTLHIRFTNKRDAGVYECQVNSDPKVSRKVTLTIEEHRQLDDPLHYGTATTDTNPQPRMMIEGPRERHIQTGSILAVMCVVRHSPHSPPDHILWFHGATNIDYDSSRGGVSIQTEKSPRKTVSKLMLSAVEQADTGEYTCSPTDLQPAVVTVHVQDGQIQQPVKQGPGRSTASTTSFLSTVPTLVLVMILASVMCSIST